MASVNLYSAEIPKVEGKKGTSPGSFVFSAVCVVLVLGMYGGLFIWQSRIDGEISGVDARVLDIKNHLATTTNETNQINDTFLRLEDMRKDAGVDTKVSLDLLERDIVTGSVIAQYDYEYDQASKSVTLRGDAVDFNTVLQQVRKFRSDPDVLSVDLDATGLSDKGFSLFTLKIVLASNNSNTKEK